MIKNFFINFYHLYDTLYCVVRCLHNNAYAEHERAKKYNDLKTKMCTYSKHLCANLCIVQQVRIHTHTYLKVCTMDNLNEFQMWNELSNFMKNTTKVVYISSDFYTRPLTCLLVAHHSISVYFFVDGKCF